jgi:NAD-dependent deacetylase
MKCIKIWKNKKKDKFEEFPKLRKILTLEYFEQNYENFWNTIKQLKKTIENKKPTIAHRLIANQKEWLVVTMNIDSLHQKAGTEKLIEVHGNLENIVCGEGDGSFC